MINDLCYWIKSSAHLFLNNKHYNFMFTINKTTDKTNRQTDSLNDKTTRQGNWQTYTFFCNLHVNVLVYKNSLKL